MGPCLYPCALCKNIHVKCRLFYDKIIANFLVTKIGLKYLIFNFYLFLWYLLQTNIAESMHLIQLLFAKKDNIWATEILDQISVLHNSYRVSMATKDSIMKQSIFFWVIRHRLSFEYGLKKFLLGAWRNLSGALRELILNSMICRDTKTILGT